MQAKLYLAVQVIAGLMLVVFGLNKFLGFISMAAPAAEMGAFMGALFATGYLMKIVAVIEIVVGLAFLLNKYVALMAVVLMPVMLNALLAHLFLDPAGIGGALMLVIFTIIIMIRHKGAYVAMLKG